MTLRFINNNVNNKINNNPEFIKYTFYELRVKENLTEDEMYSFLSLVKIRLENIGYKVYSTGQKYLYDCQEQTVKNNELLIAIKNKKR